MLVICLLNNIVLRGRGFCTSSIAHITGNVPRLLADIVGWGSGQLLRAPKLLGSNRAFQSSCKYVSERYVLSFSTWILGSRRANMNYSIEWCCPKEIFLPKQYFSCHSFEGALSIKVKDVTSFPMYWFTLFNHVTF